jgi:hypothetical protein
VTDYANNDRRSCGSRVNKSGAVESGSRAITAERSAGEDAERDQLTIERASCPASEVKRRLSSLRNEGRSLIRAIPNGGPK